ncbi:MAG: amidase [Curvibacter lanceolatus]|jgi:amidase|uniref:amidase family protein n=1 Tax=Curvibacter lanceolatus TaxID=86182 RepID=UPI000370E718|nr:amidase family protein [Curvibacter lanceolatus]MBV5296257.1 amidase [Curvibacter lanceolatus]
MTSQPSSPADALLDLDARTQVAALASGQCSALALCEAAIARIEAQDGAINAVVVRDFEHARSQARAADEALARGERRPLLGLPMTVKESFNLAGLPTTWGFEFARGLRAGSDALAVTRLKAAGAVILGKTNVPVGLGDWQSANPIYGRTRNPLDLSRTPGGSSGGGAAALAARFVALELGSDIGGSIRVPAHFCGVYGHKPSLGLLPARGHDFPGLGSGAPNELAVIGPLARSVDDLELALSVLAGPEAPKSKAYALQLPPARDMAQARCLLLDQHPGLPVSQDTQAALQAVADTLQAGGCTVLRSSERLPNLQTAHQIYAGLLNTFMTRGQPGATSISAHEWLILLDRRAALQQQWQALFEHVDVVLTPVLGCTAYPHIDPMDWASATVQMDGQAQPLGPQVFWPGIATVAGLPATSAPVGRDRDGLPIGLQVIGPMFEDLTPLALVRRLEALRAQA